ncbi:hypothetical protein E3N88_23637 [Mikania micrantha]|uniref:DC1 domain-containing protein n=1 Tax=Mikania micrantha TaxID=192012 RepID=A0A5N6NDU4_9ASTR|nr:hypothetical protein E3N88_23637 [Mikania micrantha]
MEAKEKNTKMDVKELNQQELQHEHPLILIDLQVMHRDYEEDDDYDDNELLATQNFNCICNQCGKQIDWHHRYYYKCSMPSCNYSVHKFCEELPKTLQFQGHTSHTLILKKATNDQTCHSCFGYHQDGICYHCSICNYEIDLLCATFVEQSTIHHPGHLHPLLSLSIEPGLNKCFACGEKHEGICGMEFEDDHFIYMCSKCTYYVHPRCATQRIEPFMSILSLGLGKTEKYFKDVDYPNLLQFPLDDGSHILSYQIKEDTFAHIHHMHQTLLINESSVVSLHDPMKRIKLQCTGCSRPIIKMPFFKCSTSKCHFVLHDWCSRLPEELTNHVGHRQHTLKLYKNTKDSFAFTCRICKLICNGFSYRCNQCEYFIDINCAFIPKEITHEAHASHLLTRVDASSSHLSEIECRACRLPIDKGEIYFRCSSSYFHLDCQCALILPKTIRHKLDKHSLKFSYSPVEDHKSRYFCEICEEELDPRKWFYHCVNQCAQSIHSACAPLILESEKDVNSLYVDGVYKFINIKFGAVEKKSSCIICSGDLK